MTLRDCWPEAVILTHLSSSDGWLCTGKAQAPGKACWTKVCVHRRMDSIIATSSQPHPDQPPLSFEAPYAQGIMAQYVICMRKFFITFWRNPECAYPLHAPCSVADVGHAELLSCTAHCKQLQWKCPSMYKAIFSHRDQASCA